MLFWVRSVLTRPMRRARQSGLEQVSDAKSSAAEPPAAAEKIEYAPVMELVDMRDLGSRAAMRVGSSPFRRTRTSQATYRLRRAFSFHCKTHRALILLLLASKPDPLSLGSGLGPPLRGGFSYRKEISILTAPSNKKPAADERAPGSAGSSLNRKGCFAQPRKVWQ